MAMRRTMVRLREWYRNQNKNLSDSDRILQREFRLGGPAVIGVLVLTGFLVGANEDAAWRWAITWLPLVPFGFVVRAYVRAYRREDELLQKGKLEALSFAFVGTVLVAFGYAMMTRAGAPDVGWYWIVPVMLGFFGVSELIVKRRYE